MCVCVNFDTWIFKRVMCGRRKKKKEDWREKGNDEKRENTFLCGAGWWRGNMKLLHNANDHHSPIISLSLRNSKFIVQPSKLPL